MYEIVDLNRVFTSNILVHGLESFLRQSSNSPNCLELVRSLQYPQQSADSPCHESDQSSQRTPTCEQVIIYIYIYIYIYNMNAYNLLMPKLSG